MPRSTKVLLIGLFFLSGFAGLIYESIWTNYLKLFLGHAAYAQTLVLVIFMGGMAIGSWASTLLMQRRQVSVLFGYAVAESLIGILALVFHREFVTATEFSFNSVIPHLQQPFMIDLYKWALGALLILPQTILLGATFPLMSAGFVRQDPAQQGTHIATLYFVNSLGACFGVLISGFVLIKAVGLPGTILSAGIINIFVAVCVWLLVKRSPDLKQTFLQPHDTLVGDSVTSPLLRMLLITAALTGLSSFIYEMVWIRMLVLVLGSSTHAFELMLSAFILGLAIGGFVIRRHMDNINHLSFLVGVQLTMGMLAALTILFYNSCFEFMSFMFAALQKNNQGYLLFNVSSHVLACLMMLPATICAGMTLPLITTVLLKQRTGESAIGYVYSANTVGAIAGVLLVVHVLLPLLGLKNTLVSGALIDVLLSAWLLPHAITKDTVSFQRHKIMLLIVLVSLGAISLLGKFNLHYMASGVYRHGMLDKIFDSTFHREGKTATIDVTRSDIHDFTRSQYQVAIRTNGKPDATINFGDEASMDETTMELAAFLPMSMNPAGHDIANIGLGSGLTGHAALANPDLQILDNIEIESAMVEGARQFGEMTHRVYDDPRSKMYIDDAKTFFSSHRKLYDIIISEPSNPWVSGVSSLFTIEFYTRIKSHLKPHGLMAQWIHCYETNDKVLGSIIHALSDSFADYQLYMMSGNDILIVASADGPVADPDPAFFRNPAYRDLLTRVNIHNFSDIQSRHLGGKKFFAPYLAMLDSPANSDYFPFVDQHAAESRFKNEFSQGFYNKTSLLNLLVAFRADAHLVTATDYNMMAKDFVTARLLYQRLVDRKLNLVFGDDESILKIFEQRLQDCQLSAEWESSALWVAAQTSPFLSADDANAIWRQIEQSACFKKAPDDAKNLVALLDSFTAGHDEALLMQLQNLSRQYRRPALQLYKHPFFQELIFITMIRSGHADYVRDVWTTLTPAMQQREDLRFLLMTANYKAVSI